MGAYANPSSLYLGGYSSIQGSAGIAKEINSYQGVKTAIQEIDHDAVVDYYPGVTGTKLDTVDPASVAAAKNYDAVIVVAGTDQNTADEGADRTTLALPGAQNSMISQVEAANPNTVVYLETMGEVDTGSFQNSTPALLWSSYNGQRQGAALADVLLGKVNPSGHLPFSWYANMNQIPPISDYDIRPTATTDGRTYQYFTGAVSWPFGYGLSYAHFAYSHLTVSRPVVDANGSVTVTADVTNTGGSAGADVVQLYASTPDAPAALQRPDKRLAAFTKVTLNPHQTKRVTFTVAVPNLAFFDENTNSYAVDTGRYGLQLATSSADVVAQQFIHVTGKLLPTPTVVTARPVVAGDAADGIAQRVFFPPDSTVDPQLTVSLSDQSLFGYLTLGQSTPLPAGMTVRYSSDRPSVVSVGRTGSTVRTVNPGVATVTVVVGYRGKRATGSFVVDVQPPGARQ
jgi:beta-glucosidase